jgi:ketosteroid isomerase-like protein
LSLAIYQFVPSGYPRLQNGVTRGKRESVDGRLGPANGKLRLTLELRFRRDATTKETGGDVAGAEPGANHEPSREGNNAMNLVKAAMPVMVLTVGAAGWSQPAMGQSTDADEIRRVVTSASIEGLHKNGSRDDIRAGFHPDFVMKVFQEDAVADVTIEQWIARLPPRGTSPDHVVTHRIPTVLASGRAAVAEVEVMYDGNHVFTDYMSLYRFSDGWRIVAKIFNTEE